LGCTVDLLMTDALPSWTTNRRLTWLAFPLAVAAAARRASHQGRPYDLIDVSSGDGFLVGMLRTVLGLRKSRYLCRTMGWEQEDYRVRVMAGAVPGWTSWRKGLLYRLIRFRQVQLSVQSADALITLSSGDRRFAFERGWKDLDRIYVVPCGVDDEFLNGAPSSRGGGLLYWGTWSARKGIAELVQAYTLLWSRGCEAPLTIGGCWDAVDAVRRSFPDHLRPHVRIWDRLLTEAELQEEYRSHDIFVFPSLYEGFGIVFLEAMASGLAVVATRVGGAEDIVEDGVNGRVVPPGDPEALAGVLMELWRNPDMRSRLGVAARQTAASNTWEDAAVRTLDVYKNLVAAGS
jgi:glycosyltransferase involved in cell wall biosynthesis